MNRFEQDHSGQNTEVHAMPAGQHGTVRSYVVGFILSLVFTIIPYKLVTAHLATARTLLTVVLLIAVIQMVIQVVFFLHLGREGKPRWQLYFFGGTIIGIMTVVGGSIFIMAHLHGNMSPMFAAEKTTSISQDEGIAQVEGTQTGACQSVRTEHVVMITNKLPMPAHIDAQKCDSLVFESDDMLQHTIAFGPHQAPMPYAGIATLPVSRNHGSMLILSQTGSYQFLDQQNPSVSGSFTVTP